MNFKRPSTWRKGQTLFNFLEWLRERGFSTNQNTRMADPFHIPDEELDELFEEFLKLHDSGDNSS